MGSWYVFNLGQSCACAPCPGENATDTTVPTAALRGNLGQAPDEKPTVSTESQKLGFKFWSPGVLLIFFVYLFCVFRTRPGDSCLVFVTHDFSSKRSQILRRKLGQEVEELGASRSRPFRGRCLGGCGCTWKQIGLLHLGGLLLHAFTFCRSSNFQSTSKLVEISSVTQRHCISRSRATEKNWFTWSCVWEPPRKFLQEPCCSNSVHSFSLHKGI